ncbi:zinc finger BED domain-containing protein RICESLEEPER 1-like [Melia azedarach]|uniref:Zinc finger BED domain-containing protein RICESLEEPER 1-like n=1 Tax=Melia azedarach TaxID=155640 RepID=A0ACC1YJ64_MELAZ|nr:zinc finger BED domain-containing protein RICESLEEPER 1-like [Melia azedarach]
MDIHWYEILAREQETSKEGEVNGNQAGNNMEMIDMNHQNVRGNSSPIKRRKMQSKVWDEMTKFVAADGRVCAKCTHCEKVFDGSSKKGTTHLKNHLQRCLRKRNNEAGDNADKPMDQVMNFTPPVVVEEKSVTDLIKSYYDRLGWPTKHWDPLVLNSRKVEILQIYKEEKKELRRFFSQLSCRFSLLIVDFLDWYVLSVYYIDNSWQQKTKTIHISPANKDKEDHQNYHNLVEILKESCLDLKIDGNICSIIYEFSGKTHDFIISDHEDFMREINSWFNRDKTKCMEKEVDISDLSPTNDSFLYFERALGYKDAFCNLEQIDIDFKSLSINLTKEQWDEATVICQQHKELSDSFGSLAESKDTTLNGYVPKFCDLYMKLLPLLQRSQSYHLDEKTSTSMKKFASALEKYDLVLVIAGVLDPRFKMDIAQLWYHKIYGRDADHYFEKIMDDFNNIYKNYYAKVYESGDVASSYLDALGRPSTFIPKSSELERYLCMPKVPPVKMFDILGWWRVYTPIFPTLARMARDFLAFPIHIHVVGFGHFHYKAYQCTTDCEDLDDDIKPALLCLTEWLNSNEK